MVYFHFAGVKWAAAVAAKAHQQIRRSWNYLQWSSCAWSRRKFREWRDTEDREIRKKSIFFRNICEFRQRSAAALGRMVCRRSYDRQLKWWRFRRRDHMITVNKTERGNLLLSNNLESSRKTAFAMKFSPNKLDTSLQAQPVELHSDHLANRCTTTRSCKTYPLWSLAWETISLLGKTKSAAHGLGSCQLLNRVQSDLVTVSWRRHDTLREDFSILGQAPISGQHFFLPAPLFLLHTITATFTATVFFTATLIKNLFLIIMNE